MDNDVPLGVRSRALILGIAFVLVSPAFLISPALADAPFSDVDALSMHAEALTYLKEKGIVEGYEDGSFQVDKAMNRAEALKMLYTAVGQTADAQMRAAGTATFPDVAEGAWYAPFVEHARSQGVVQGYPDGTFKPGNLINKAEALKILLTIMEEGTADVDRARRVALGRGEDIWYAPYVLQSYDRGLLDALNPENYTVAGNVTRGELAQMLYRLMYIREQNKSSYVTSTTGRVSYYHDDFIGKSTASGEPYAADAFSAAHPEAPLRSFVQVVDNAAKKSMLVRINDRGPFGEGVLDLSRAAFEVFYKTSKGIFEGTVFKLPATIQAPSKTYITGAFFENMRPVSTLPDIFWQNEIYLLAVDGGSQTPVLSLTSPSKKIEIIEATQAGTQKVYQLSFAEQGTYTLERASNNTVSVRLTVLPEFQGKHVTEPKIQELTLTLKQTAEPFIEWSSALPDVVFRLTATQGGVKKTVYVNAGDAKRLALRGPLFAGMDFSQKITWLLEGAQTTTRFSHDIYTPWKEVARHDSAESAFSSVSSTPLSEGQLSDVLKPEEISDQLLTSETLQNTSALQQMILNRVNEERAKVGSKPLMLDSTLNAMAIYKSEDMAVNNYFSHPDPQGRDVNVWKDQFAFVPLVAENIAYSTQGVEHALENLIKSPGHYANIVDPRFEIMGTGTALMDRKTFLTQHFSTRPVSREDISQRISELKTRVKTAGVAASFDNSIASVAQRWCDDISTRSQMSFTLAGKEIGSVLREEIGNYGFQMSVYGDSSLETISQRLMEQVQKNATASAYGFGLAQGQDGMIRLTVVVKK